MLGKPPILLDLDGVLLNTNEAYLAYCREHLGLAQGIHHEDVTAYLFHECIPGLTQEMSHAIFQDHRFWKQIAPYPGAVAFAHRAYEDFETHIVTDRRWFDQLPYLTAWLLGQQGLPFDYLVPCKGSEKCFYAARHRCVAAIEDSTKNAASFVCPTVLVARPWNKEEGEEEGLTRIQVHTPDGKTEDPGYSALLKFLKPYALRRAA